MTAIEQVIEAPLRDLGGLFVRRSLPTAKRRHVGPFVFLDQFGPVELPPGQGLDVRPHPHIGLATVTWVFEGTIVHRDSLGVVQPIHPGDVNWMNAGRGIVHSERSPDEARAGGARLSGMQSWVALPVEKEESEPWFRHYPAKTLPVVERGGARLTVIAGEAFGARSPVEVASPMIYVDAPLPAGTVLDVPREHEELAAYVAFGRIEAGGRVHEAGTLVVFGPGDARVEAVEDARVMLLGGEPMPEERHIVWNFVHHSRDRIDAAAQAWAEERFPTVPDDPERIPLPDHLTNGKWREPQPL